MEKPYKSPRHIFIGNAPSTEKLMSLEQKRNRIIKECTRELSVILDIEETNFWTIALPQALYDTLESFDVQASLHAAVAFIRDHQELSSEITR